MAGSIFGTIFQISTWGESHGKGIGVVIDGCPAGIPMTEEWIQSFLDRRKPGQTRYSTPRKENDIVTIQSGIFENVTTGTPISLSIFNETQRSSDYSEIAGFYRPGHADFTYDAKYGFRDYRGGGRSSGRETIGRVAAGAIACAFLKELGINVFAYTKSIGPVQIDYENCKRENFLKSPLYMPDLEASARAEEYLLATMQEQDSAGGIIECIVSGLPAGIGEPVFDKLDACLAKAIFSIGAVKGFEIGSGFSAATKKGSENNDAFLGIQNGLAKNNDAFPGIQNGLAKNNDAFLGIQNGLAIKQTNHAGGILGGISNGADLLFRAAIKPTPSIARVQQTITKEGAPITISIKGRHDPVIVPRAVVVVESMAAITLADLLLVNMASRMDRIKKFYQK